MLWIMHRLCGFAIVMQIAAIGLLHNVIIVHLLALEVELLAGLIILWFGLVFGDGNIMVDFGSR